MVRVAGPILSSSLPFISSVADQPSAAPALIMSRQMSGRPGSTETSSGPPAPRIALAPSVWFSMARKIGSISDHPQPGFPRLTRAS